MGSSKSRSKKQEDEAKAMITAVIEDTDDKSMVTFTDGSCRGNPGPCGSGAFVLLPYGETVELKQPVSKHSSILVGEVVAIEITLVLVTEEIKKRQIQKVKILSDSQSAVGILSLGWENNSHPHLCSEIRQLWRRVEETGCKIDLQWTPGHANIHGNDKADAIAKEAAKEAEEFDQPTSQTEIRAAASLATFDKWQRRWEISESGRTLFQYQPKVNRNKVNFDGLPHQRSILALQSGYCLKDYNYKVGLTDCPYCECGSREAVEHFYCECPICTSAREKAKKEMFLLTGIPVFSEKPFLTIDENDPYKEWRRALNNELNDFIEATKRFGTRGPRKFLA
ncbi:uncharacterized protein LOC123544590 [Mercenaria mercenaria]|uniref:uncharacterized protein LOC123544590 n=1 Tax=Mercenaria mercenaria TaxID=6596 RepID=UPI00234F38DB|nr:uncharacterized protein LOC123544590 [Mercenaria mercenaria]